MAGRVQNKVVVVTGAARGQGLAEAHALAAEGAHVYAADIAEEDAETAAWPGRGSVTRTRLDVTSPDGWQALRDLVGERHQRVDGLVNNAGIASRDRLPEVSLENWHRAFEVNVTGALLGIQTLFPLFATGTSIVNVSSVAGLSGHAAAPYTASKWALRGLSRTASLELGERGIRVNTIFPGLIDTPLLEGASPAFRRAAIGEVPLDRIGQPEDVAPLVVYLISDESRYVNGAEIAVDGGLTAHVSHKSVADATRLQ
jgi:3alpha(or 20beta)-hydroxysteroid dehydrogenase